MRAWLQWAILATVAAVLWSAPCPAAEKLAGKAPEKAAEAPAEKPGAKTPQPLPPRIEFALSDVRYQALPNEVRGVRVGPDDRVWLDMHSPVRPYDSDWCRRQIEREFSQKSPQLTNIVPILFEPGGRIWFMCNWDWALLGYDGHTFIENAAPKEDIFRGKGVWAGGCALFAGDSGVFCYDGKAWTFKRIFPEGYFKTHVLVTGRMVRMLPQADGRTVLVLTRGYGLWRWRQGGPAAAGAASEPQWTEIKLPPGAVGSIQSAVPWDDGVLIVPEKGPLFMWRDETAPVADVSSLVKRLGAADFKDREAATQEFIAMGARGLGPARQTLRSAADPEIRERLKKIIAQLENPPVMGLGYFSIGQYRFENPVFPEQSELDVRFIWSPQIIEGDRPLGPGLAMVMPGGEVRTLLGGWDQLQTYTPVGTFAVMPDKSVWCSFNNYRDQPAHRIDLKEGKFVDDPAGQAFGLPMAGRRDGMNFFRVRFNSAIVAYKESAKDDRRIVDAQKYSGVAGPGYYYKYNPEAEICYDSIAPDGRLWTVSPESLKAVSIYDGKGWKELPQPENVTGVMPGRDGAAVLSWPHKDITLLAGGKSFKEENMETLIERHAKEFASAFASDDRSYYNMGSQRIVADKAGNVWMLDNGSPRSLKVLAGGKWLDVLAAMKEAGTSYFPMFISAVGDSSRIATFGSNRNQAFLLEVKDGKVAFEALRLGAETDDFGPPGIRDFAKSFRGPDGAVWFMGIQTIKFPPQSPVPTVDLPIRVTHKGVDIPGAVGQPWLADKGGNLWLARKRAPWDPKAGADTLWELAISREGKIASTLSVPGLRGDGGSFLVSDRAGSAWAWTATGLYHLVAADPNQPARFAIKSSYFVRGVDGQVASVRLSPLGFLAVRTVVVPEKFSEEQYTFYIVPLPKE
jgi:hypothetical protein